MKYEFNIRQRHDLYIKFEIEFTTNFIAYYIRRATYPNRLGGLQ